MSRPKKSIDPDLVVKAEKEFNKLKEGELALRLKAIIAFGDNKVELVAQILKVSVRSIFRWVNNFKEYGISGLLEKPKGHYQAKLTSDQKRQIKEWILKGQNSKGEKVNWTLKKMQLALKNEFNLTISQVGLWKNFKQMNLVVKKPRPIHAKADIDLQEKFKKKRNKK